MMDLSGRAAFLIARNQRQGRELCWVVIVKMHQQWPPTADYMSTGEQGMFQEAFPGMTDDESSYLVQGNPGGSKGPAGGRGKGKEAAAKPKANKKRDQRADLVEIWMTKNNALEDPKPEVKKRYAEVSDDDDDDDDG